MKLAAAALSLFFVALAPTAHAHEVSTNALTSMLHHLAPHHPAGAMLLIGLIATIALVARKRRSR